MADQSIHPAGQWRNEPVWIGRSSESPMGADYVAPRYQRIPELIDDFLVFARREDIPVLLLAALSHAQFETIHPFTHGNGRTGRAIIHAILRHHGLLRTLVVPVSAGLLADVEGYHSALMEYRKGNIVPIVSAFCSATFRACSNARQLISDVRDIRASWDLQLSVRKSSHAWRLLDIICRRPVLDASTAAEELGASLPNVYPALKVLTEAGVLIAGEGYRFGTIWRNPEVLSALDAFVERAGRRAY